jgi:uncharacterized protein YndB with AHSA1/START domain
MEWTNEQTIDAPPDVVWQLTTDVTAWPSYMPTVTSLERLENGPLRLGAGARIKQPGQREAVWLVTRFEPGHEFSWRSERRGLTFVGTHRVEPEGAGSRNVLTIEMTGPLAPVLGLLMGPFMRRVLRTENACFAARAEGRTANTPESSPA